MQHVVWLPRAVMGEMRLDADQWYDKETGGTFMGYWAESNVAVVTAMIPGGPNAVRERYSFPPDQDWQHAEIASHYEQSGRLDTYLGDWHMHPGAVSGGLSWKDRACLKRIVRTPSERGRSKTQWRRTMLSAADYPEASVAIRVDLGAIFVSMELGKSTWLITSLSPGGGEKMSRHAVTGGDIAGLFARFGELRKKGPEQELFKIIR